MVTGTTQGGSNLLSLAFGYGTSSDNNGNVLSQTITMPKQTSGTLTLQQAYGYDGVNRLQSAGETVTAGGSGGGAWSFTHGYDQFGNMWVSSTTGLAAHSATPRAGDQFGATTNRLTKAFDGSTLSNPYDEVGNLINHPYVGAMQYDAENRQKQFTSGSTTATYHYDGDGRRVKRVLGGQTTVYVYDAFGMLAAEYSTTAPEETGGRRYRTTDHLGSTRLMTNSAGAVVSRHDYVPFGEELQASSSAGNRNLVFGFGVSPSERHKFTGKERDVESGLDYFGARYFGASLGRFTSADEPFADQEVANPQSWNLYSYVRSNPLRAIDPTGRCSQAADGGYTDEGNGLFEGPCASGVIGDTDTKNPNSITVGVGRDVANLIMLQGVGENLSSSQQWASVITGAGRDTMGVIAPFATELAECLGGNCSGFNLAVAAVPGGTVVTKLTRWGWTGGLKWRRALAALKKPGDHTAIEKIVPTVEEAAELIKAGKGKILRIESGHALGGPSTHTYDHINYLTEAGQKATVKVQR